MKLKKQEWKMLWLLAFVILVASGCVSYDANGNPTGAVYQYFGVPTVQLLDYLAHIFGGSYGISIMIVRFIVMLFMLPSSLQMTKSSMISSARMKYAQPEIQEIQAELKASKDPQEQAALNQELRQVYAKYDINMLGGMSGCLPLLLQMPIIAAVYAAVSTSERIAQSSFLGINLGGRSLILVVLVTLVSLAQSWLMAQNSPVSQDENSQAAQMSKSMLWMNPIMFGYFTYIANAGIGLYFLAGAVFSLIQQIYMNHVVKPKIQAEIDAQAEKYANMPRERRKKAEREIKKALEKENDQRIVPLKTTQSTPSKGRNAGKQKR